MLLAHLVNDRGLCEEVVGDCFEVGIAQIFDAVLDGLPHRPLDLAFDRQSDTMKDDLANRSRDIHWPTGFDPAKADLFAHNELVIHAPCERVWQHT